MQNSRVCPLKKIILVSGLPGSGKSILGKIAAEKGIPVINMGDIIRDIAREKNLEPIDKNLGMIAIEIREKFGRAAVAVLALEKACTTRSPIVVIEGLRSLEEFDYLRSRVQSYALVAFHASPKTRFNRLLSRGRSDDPQTWEEFEIRDRRELNIGIGSVIALADIMIVNENLTVEQLTDLVEKTLENIIRG